MHMRSQTFNLHIKQSKEMKNCKGCYFVILRLLLHKANLIGTLNYCRMSEEGGRPFAISPMGGGGSGYFLEWPIPASSIFFRYKKTQKETETLKLVQKELSHLDDLLSIDVQILRDKIDDACRDYDAAQYVGLNDTIIWQWHHFFFTHGCCVPALKPKNISSWAQATQIPILRAVASGGMWGVRHPSNNVSQYDHTNRQNWKTG